MVKVAGFFIAADQDGFWNIAKDRDWTQLYGFMQKCPECVEETFDNGTTISLENNMLYIQRPNDMKRAVFVVDIPSQHSDAVVNFARNEESYASAVLPEDFMDQQDDDASNASELREADLIAFFDALEKDGDLTLDEIEMLKELEQELNDPNLKERAQALLKQQSLTPPKPSRTAPKLTDMMTRSVTPDSLPISLAPQPTQRPMLSKDILKEGRASLVARPLPPKEKQEADDDLLNFIQSRRSSVKGDSSSSPGDDTEEWDDNQNVYGDMPVAPVVNIDEYEDMYPSQAQLPPVN